MWEIRDEVNSNQRRLCSALSLPTPFHHILTTQLVFSLRLTPHLTPSHIKHPTQAPLPCSPPPSPPLFPPLLPCLTRSLNCSPLLLPSPSLIPSPSYPSSLISFIPAFFSSPSPSFPSIDSPFLPEVISVILFQSTQGTHEHFMHNISHEESFFRLTVLLSAYVRKDLGYVVGI